MNEYQLEAMHIEERIQVLTQERIGLLKSKRPLTAAEVDRIFEINAAIDWQFQCEAMVLPMLEDKKTRDRFSSPLSRELDKMLPI